MDDQRDDQYSHPKRRFAKRIALATMIALTATAGSAAGVMGEELPTVNDQTPANAPRLTSGMLLHSVPASEYVSFRSPLGASVVTVGTDRTGVKPSEATQVTGTTIADMLKNKPTYAQRPCPETAVETLKPYIAPESLADLVRTKRLDESNIPGGNFETELSMPIDFQTRFDDTRDFAATGSLNHVGIPVLTDAVNVRASDFKSTSSRSYSQSQVSRSPARSTNINGRVVDLSIADQIAEQVADQRTRRVADSLGFEMFSIQDLQPPAPEVSPAEAEVPSMNATVHAKRLHKLAQAALIDSRSRLRRRATHSAKKYALEALRLSIDIEDAVDGGNHHVRDLRIAQNAIRESKDFEGITTTVDWRSIQRMVAAHETEILKAEDLKNVSAVQATESYLNLARTKLVSAAGHSALAAESMLLLGMIEKQVLSREDVHSGAVSLIYHGAATEIQPSSAEAHREYGRTLLQQGLADQSIRSLKHSLALHPSRSAYQSLLDASRRCGDYDLARDCINALEDPTLFNDTAVVQLQPRQFAASYRPTPQTINATPSSSTSKPAGKATEPAKENTRISFRSFFSFGRR